MVRVITCQIQVGGDRRRLSERQRRATSTGATRVRGRGLAAGPTSVREARLACETLARNPTHWCRSLGFRPQQSARPPERRTLSRVQHCDSRKGQRDKNNLVQASQHLHCFASLFWLLEKHLIDRLARLESI